MIALENRAQSPAAQARILQVDLVNGVLMLELAFYFPFAGEGSNAGLLDRLRAANLETLDLGAIRWRLTDRPFFLEVTQLLRERLHFSPAITAYGFHHNDVASIREYLENSVAAGQLGQWLDSDLLEIRPRTHHAWETLEFDPLVNARAHRFANESRLTHQAAREHYQALLDQLGWKPPLDSTDQLSLAGAYLGVAGLGCFLSGQYSSECACGGMLGYAQAGDCGDWNKLLQENLGKLGAISETHDLPDFPTPSIRSRHTRVSVGSDISIFHTILRFN